MNVDKRYLANSLEAAVDHASFLLDKDIDISARLAASSSKIGNKLIFKNGWVIKTKTENWLGQKKNFYDVYDAKTGRIEAKDLGLFASAIALVKMKSSRIQRDKSVKDVLDIDRKYQHHLTDAALFGIRLKSKRIHDTKKDVYKIRMEEAMRNCQHARTELRSYI